MTAAKRLSVMSALLLCAGALSACAAANTAAPSQTQTAYRGPNACVRTGSVVNVNKVDDETVYVATERGYVFRLDMPRGCPASGFVGAFSDNAETCNGSQVRVGAGAGTPTTRSMLMCVAQVSGPYADSRVTGLWSRTVAN